LAYTLTHFDSRKAEANQQSQGSLESCARAAALGRELGVSDYLPTVGAKSSYATRMPDSVGGAAP
jgi:hypothetical protein